MYSNSIIVDNFTIYSALRSISKRDNYIRTAPVSFSSLKLAFDVASLATLVELVVLHEKLYVDMQTRLWENEELSDIVVPINISNRDELIRKAISKVEKVEFNDIEAKSMLEILEDRKIPKEEFDKYSEWDLHEIRSHIPEHHAAIKDLPLEIGILKILGKYGGARDHDYAMATDFRGKIDHHLIKWGGFLLGAFYYDLVSKELQLPYVPHLTRSHVIAFEMAREINMVDARQIAQKLVKIIAHTREVTAGGINEYFGHKVFDLQMPAVFSALIKNAKSPEDVLISALDLRESRQGKAVRSWMSDFLNAISAGDLARTQRYVRDLKQISEDLLGKKLDTDKTAFDFQIALGPINIDPAEGKLGSLLRQRTSWRPLRILRFLTDEILQVKNILPYIRNTFGDIVAGAVDAYPKSIYRSEEYYTHFEEYPMRVKFEQ